jgi:mono/diheme cytochrome c family protein
MRHIHISVFVAGCGIFSWAGDAQRGAQILEREKCVQCHSIRGEGGKSAPDLGRRIAHRYTPPVMASVMWNHAPAMWARMAAEGVRRPELGEQDAGDLFAYFYSVRFFDAPGEAQRGKRVFESKHCSECHDLSKSPLTSLGDPILLVQQMWVHSASMTGAFERRRFRWQTLTGQELNDLSVYLRNLPGAMKPPVQFSLPDPASGKELFVSVCSGCHKGSLSLEQRLSNRTLNDIAADMWNHAPRMTAAPTTGPEEMRKIIAYVWERQYLGAAGDAGRGRRVFENKNCAGCHKQPPGAGGNFSPVTLVSALWAHGPEMRDRMTQQGLSWPHLSAGNVSDLVSYLNSKR